MPLAAVLLAFAASALHAQFRSRVDIVQVTVSVTDANGRLVKIHTGNSWTTTCTSDLANIFVTSRKS